MFDRLRPHLTYANVMATIAVFAVIIGGATALGGKKKKSSAQIPSGSVELRDLKKKTRKAFVPAHKVKTSGSLMKLSVGETKTVFAQDPLTLSAACIDIGGGNVRFQLTVTSSQPGSQMASGPPNQTLTPGEPFVIFSGDSNGPILPPGRFLLQGPTSIGNADGTTFNLGLYAYGAKVFGADCVLSTFSVG